MPDLIISTGFRHINFSAIHIKYEIGG